MITEKATVVEIKDNDTWIETQRQTACGSCSANKGCGTSVLSKVLGNKLSRMKAINKISAHVGDEVIVGLNEESLLKGAFMTYLLPLFYLFSFSIFADFVCTALSIQNKEFVIIVSAALGFYFGLKRLKRFSHSIKDDERFQPVILKKSVSIPSLVNI